MNWTKPIKSAFSATLKLDRHATVLVLLVGTYLPLISSGAPGDNWGRALVPIGSMGPAPGVPLTISDIGCYVTVSANGWYSYTQGRDPVVLHGKWEDDRRSFYPVVAAYEVATEGKARWRKLRTESDEPNSDTATVSPEKPVIRVTMDMEPLRSWIGTYRYGKVVLENGDAAIIELEDLLPPANSPDSIGNFKEDVGGGSAMLQHQFKLPRPNDPAVLSNVISLGSQLIGEFIFDSRSETVGLTGTRTLDGDFWPTATLQVGNSERDWREVGRSTSNGTPATLQIKSGEAERFRILLTDCKPLIASYKYGKIVFSNGQSVVFYLDLLDPQPPGKKCRAEPRIR